MKRVFLILGSSVAILMAISAGMEIAVVAREIRQQSTVDEARPADVIIVLGAAEYRGKPSPVLEARLNHALSLYFENMAPRILTTGGAGGDKTFTEGGVAHAYLSRHGVEGEAILVESEGETTVQSIAAAVLHRGQRRLSHLPGQKNAGDARPEGVRIAAAGGREAGRQGLASAMGLCAAGRGV
jgi:vancomycin permeability regulator SanA